MNGVHHVVDEEAFIVQRTMVHMLDSLADPMSALAKVDRILEIFRTAENERVWNVVSLCDCEKWKALAHLRPFFLDRFSISLKPQSPINGPLVLNLRK